MRKDELSDKVRAVNGAISSAKSVLDLTGKYRSSAEAAINAAQAWVDNPNEMTMMRAHEAGHEADNVARSAYSQAPSSDSIVWAVLSAVWAAYAVGADDIGDAMIYTDKVAQAVTRAREADAEFTANKMAQNAKNEMP